MSDEDEWTDDGRGGDLSTDSDSYFDGGDGDLTTDSDASDLFTESDSDDDEKGATLDTSRYLVVKKEGVWEDYRAAFLAPTGILAGAPGLVMSILCFTLMIRVCYLLSLLSLFSLIFHSRPALILAIRA